jgi:hypothetical protein
MAKTKQTDEQEYEGYRIELTSVWEFRVHWDDEDYDDYKSLKDAHDAVDKQVTRDKKEKRVVLSIPVIRTSNNEAPTKHTVTGMNIRTKALMMTPKTDRWGSPNYYLDTPDVLALLTEITRKEFEITKLNERLKPVMIPDSYDRPENFNLSNWHKSALKKAEKL